MFRPLERLCCLFLPRRGSGNQRCNPRVIASHRFALELSRQICDFDREIYQVLAMKIPKSTTVCVEISYSRIKSKWGTALPSTSEVIEVQTALAIHPTNASPPKVSFTIMRHSLHSLALVGSQLIFNTVRVP